MIEVPSRPLQSGTSDELGSTRSPFNSRRDLAPVAEFKSSDVVAMGVDRPFSDVQVNISSSSSKDEGHLNLPVIEPEVGTRSSECKALRVDPAISSGTVMGVGIPLTSLPVDVEFSAVETISEVEITFKPRTTGAPSAFLGRPDPPPHQARSTCPPDRPGEACTDRHIF